MNSEFSFARIFRQRASSIGGAVAALFCLLPPGALSQIWQTTTAPARVWSGVACSSDATKIVAVAYSGQIYTSSDSGGTWTARASIHNWQAVASSADGVKLVAVAYGGQIYTSTNSGVDWTPQASIRNWQSVASSADGTRVVAGVNNGQIYTSTANSTAGTAGYLTGGQSTALELQFIGNGQFHPLSHEGAIIGN